MKLVKVEWIDARTILDPILIQDLEKEQPIKTIAVGYLVKDSEDVIVVSSFKCEEGEINSFKYSHIIPKCLVKSIEELEEVSK